MTILYRSTVATVNTITLTVTHSLSRTPNRIAVHAQPANTTGWISVVGINTNTVLLRASADASACNLTVLEYHSIQGGPAAV